MTATMLPTKKVPDVVPHSVRHGFNWGNLGTGVVMALNLVWCLAPFYWMTVLAFRSNNFTFATDPWFSHVTLDNFRYAFNTQYNTFGRSLANSLIIGGSVTIL